MVQLSSIYLIYIGFRSNEIKGENRRNDAKRIEEPIRFKSNWKIDTMFITKSFLVQENVNSNRLIDS